MLQTLDHVPAFILGRRTDVLASNRLARAVLTDFEALPHHVATLARFYLLDPAARERTVAWERIAAENRGRPSTRSRPIPTIVSWPIWSANSWTVPLTPARQRRNLDPDVGQPLL